MTDAAELAAEHTMAELVAMRQEVCDAPANQQAGFNRYTEDARDKLNAIAWAITYKLKEERNAHQSDN